MPTDNMNWLAYPIVAAWIVGGLFINRCLSRPKTGPVHPKEHTDHFDIIVLAALVTFIVVEVSQCLIRS